jgi:glycerol-3-phosphate dehydrogenase
VINATGCFGDAIRKMDDPSATPLIVGAAGTHVILPDHFSPDNMGLIIPKTRDGRVLFFLPWEGMTICGTTDSPSDITMSPAPTEDDVRFIIEESNRYLSRKITLADVRAAWSGIRPLIKDPAKLASGSTTAQLSRKHVVEANPTTGMVSILGGKWTTYRKMAEDAIDAFAKAKGVQVEPSKTLNMQLLGADRAGIVFNKRYDRIPVTLRETYGLDKDVARHLSRNYGTRALQIGQLVAADRDARQEYEGAKAAMAGVASSSWGGSSKGKPTPVGFNPALPPLGSRLANRHPILVAEVVFAVEQEYAETVVDVLARRTRLAFLDSQAAKEATPTVINIMAQLLGWSKERQAKELEATQAFLATMITPSTAALLSSVKAEQHTTNLQAIQNARPAPPASVQKAAQQSLA